MLQKVTTEYYEELYEIHPVTNGTGIFTTVVGRRKMRAEVSVEIDIEKTAKTLGK